MTLKTTMIAGAALIAAGLAAPQAASAASISFGIGIGSGGGFVHVADRTHVRTRGHHGRRGQNRHLTPKQIGRRLGRHGFYRIYGYNRRGRVYVTTALNRNGHLYRLRVNALDGDIISQRVIRRGWRQR